MSYENIISLFLQHNPEPTDEQVHSLAYALNVDHQELEAIVYEMLGRVVNKLYSAESLASVVSLDPSDYMDGEAPTPALKPVVEDEEALSRDGPKVIRASQRLMAAARLQATDNTWVNKVKPKPSAKELPEGTFSGSPGKIVQDVMNNSEDYQQAMSRINFYLNRGGKGLSPTDRSRVEKAKEMLEQRYGDKEK